MKDFKIWLDLFKDKTEKEQKESLQFILSKIEFLESIYQTGGKNNFYSKEFKDLAFNEQEQLCLLTSSIYSFLREE